MSKPQPFFREAGSGPGVVCIHSNASSSSQWRGLMDLLSSRYRVFAPDSYGAGKSPDWHSDRVIALQDEVDFIQPVLAQAGSPLVLVGHSYGAAVALKAALADPARVRALVLYEPTLFALVNQQSPPPNDADGIHETLRSSGAALDQGDLDAAARHFIDYWTGSGSWDAMPEKSKPSIAQSMVNARRWGHALLNEPTPLPAFAALDMPVLYLLGERSPQSTQGVARALIPVLPRVRVVELPGVGHMAPIMQADVVNAEIERFLGTI